MKNCKKHSLPTTARLSANGNFLIKNPTTGLWYWFNQAGDCLGLTAVDYKVQVETEDGWDWEWDTAFGAEPEFLADMFEVPLNMSWTTNVFIAKFSTGRSRQQRDRYDVRGDRRGNGSTAKNINGRRFNLVSNPKQFRLDFTTGIYSYVVKPSAAFRTGRHYQQD